MPALVTRYSVTVLPRPARPSGSAAQRAPSNITDRDGGSEGGGQASPSARAGRQTTGSAAQRAPSNITDRDGGSEGGGQASPSARAGRQTTGSAALWLLSGGVSDGTQTHFAVMAYRRDMPAAKSPTARDAETARQILLDGLANDTDVLEIVARLAPLHPRHNTFPGEVFVGLAADALEWAGVDRVHPVVLEGIRERFLPECNFDGRDRRKFQFAVLAAAAHHGGADVDLLDEVAWWHADDFWRFAAYAAITYLRLAADRVGVPELEACRGVAHKPLPWP
jgi:hypothetical protein